MHPGARLTLHNPIAWAEQLRGKELKTRIDDWVKTLLDTIVSQTDSIEDVDLSQRLLVRAITDVSLTATEDLNGYLTYAQPLLPGLSLILVLDSPGTYRWVTDDDLNRLSQSPKELFELGLSNTMKLPLPVSNITEDGMVQLFEGESICTSALVARIEHLVPQAAYGIAFAMPISSILVAAAIQSEDSMKTVFQEIAQVVGQIVTDPEMQNCDPWPKLYFRSNEGEVQVVGTVTTQDKGNG